MEELSKEGVDIPNEMPATFIQCDNIQEAAKLVLAYSSMYAKITETGLFDFVQMYDLQWKELSTTLDLPGLDEMAVFNDDTPVDPFADPGTQVKNQYGVIVMCNDEESQEGVFNSLTDQGYNCKIVVT